ncbi:MAG TPA: alpha/beta fold hydrolase [Rectinemataceae bacterium]|nr:alpha/beta fold hydrolase [Rectinemataceae bacterium]
MRLRTIAFLAIAMAAFTLPAIAETPSMDEFIVYIPNEGRMIPATVCLPVGQPGETFPAVVMLHGTGSNREEAGNGYRMLAPYMAENGIASIRIDFAGSGDSAADYVEYTWSSGASDAAAAADFMAKLAAVDPQRIGIMGWSQGGSVAILAASRYSEFKALLTWAGAVDMSAYMASQYAEALVKGFTKMTFEWRTPLNLSLQWYEDVKSISLRDELNNFYGPVLAIAGSADEVVPLSALDDIVASAAGNDKAKLLIDGADHTFNVFTGDLGKYNELRNATTSWFKEKL